MTNNKIIATDETIREIVLKEIEQEGEFADLNHIDVSNVTDMSKLFSRSFDGEMFFKPFNGDISKWDVSKVTDMHSMFFKANFNGDISKWNVSNVKGETTIHF